MPPKPLIYGVGVGALLSALMFGLPKGGIKLGGGGGGVVAELGGPTLEFPDWVAVMMQVLISLIILGAALWVILSRKYQPTDRHWAYGLVGTVIGFWLHS
jgi:hypothetical protein